MSSLAIEDGVVKGATVPGIIEWLVKDNTDAVIVDQFFSSFPQFMTATQVWLCLYSYFSNMSATELKEKLPDYVFATQQQPVSIAQSDSSQNLGLSLSQSTSGPTSTTSVQRPKTTRESVFNFLYAWLERSFFRDFLQTKNKRENMFESLLTFLRTVHQDTSNRFKLLMIKSAAERKRRNRFIKLGSNVNSGANTPNRSNSSSSLNNSNSNYPPSPSVPHSNAAILSMIKELQGAGNPGSPMKNPGSERKAILEPGKFDFIDLDPQDVAQQLTIIEFDLFRGISESELFKLSWRNDNPKRMILAPNVCKLVERFNTVSYWVATEIVMVTGLRDRVQVLRKFIQVAEHLKDMRNFNGVMEVIGGINMWAVTRLKQTWEQLPPRSNQIVEELNSLMENKANYKNYRNALRSAPLPLMPYLGVYLRDLTFIEENKDWYGENKGSGLFNFEKLLLMGQVITEMKKFQTSDYLFDRNEVLQEYLSKLLTLPEEMLIKHSQLCEQHTRDSN